MKKLFIAAACALAIGAVSCSKSPEQQALDLLNEYSAKFEKVESIEEFMKLGTEMGQKAMELEQKYPEANLDDSEAVKAATEKFQAAAEAAGKRLTESLDLSGLEEAVPDSLDDVVEVVEEAVEVVE